jgi:hypothetical protein
MNIYEKHPATDAYRVRDSYEPYAVLAAYKRFTDAELVAEYWAAHGEANATMTGNPRLPFSKRQTIKRFAILPHFDEMSE